MILHPISHYSSLLPYLFAMDKITNILELNENPTGICCYYLYNYDQIKDSVDINSFRHDQ